MKPIYSALTALGLTLLITACGGGGSGGSSGGGSGGGSSSSSSSSASASSSSSSSGALIEPSTPAAATVSFEIHSDQDRKAISPLIYGTNSGDFTNARLRHLTFNRAGGNRITAYNWETNASNAGNDYFNQNDDFLSASNTPGAAFTTQIQDTLNAGGDYVMSLPMIGYVAADKNGGGDVNQTADFIHTRFNVSLPAKGAAFTTTPDLTDGKVYQDEFVAFLKTKFPAAFTGTTARISFMLDNEPDLWASTHRRLRGSSTAAEGTKATYAEIFQLTKDYARAIKAVAPNALVYGPASYGWGGYVDFQGAPDAASRDFINTYLDEMKTYETANGQRILDVLDLHWYPEAQSSTGVRITDNDNSAAVVTARLQAPRSLYDSTYIENSWISQYSAAGGVIRLIPLMKDKIAAHYPNTKLSFSEYNYGGGNHISGGVAEADVLGIFGREGVYYANMWPLLNDNSFIYGGFDMYRNFDGAGSTFGDTSIKATTTDGTNTAIYASIDAAHPERTVIVLVNRGGTAVTTNARLWQTTAYATGHVWRLEGTTSTPQDKGTVAVSGNSFSMSLPAYSVTTVVLGS